MILTGLLPARDRLVWETRAGETLSLRQKVQHYVGNVFRLGLGVLALPSEAEKSLWGRCFPVKSVAPNGTQSLPAHCGFADSLFQTSGLGTKHSATNLVGQCKWSHSMNPKCHARCALGPDTNNAGSGNVGTSRHRRRTMGRDIPKFIARFIH